jgi:hypothetical protein
MADPNYDVAGRYVWTLVLANHQRLNTAAEGCKVVTIGESNWYKSVVHNIWAAAKPTSTLALRTTSKFCSKGVDIVATMDKIVVVPCGGSDRFEFDLPDDFEYVGPKNVGE